MIDEKVVESLIRLLDESSLDNLEIERAGTRIRLSKSPSGAGVVSVAPAGPVHAPAGPALEAAGSGPAAHADTAPADASAPAPPDSDLTEVASPMVGTFYRAPSPEADPYASVGDVVAVGDVLCVIEAMKLMNELECEVAGRVAEVCVRNADPVEYGQVLFRIDPA